MKVNAIRKEYLKRYGIDVCCEIASLFDSSDTDKLNAIKMLLDNLSEWWGAYFNCEQEKIEYDKLEEVREKLNDLISVRENYINLMEEESIPLF